MEAYNEGKFKVDGVEIPIQCIMLHLDEKKHYNETHYHDYIELLYGIEGKVKILLDGIPYTYGKGDLVVINSRETHNLNALTPNTKYIVVKFLPEILYTTEQTAFELKYMLPFTLSGAKHQRIFRKSELDKHTESLMFDIYNEWEKKEYAYELAMRSDILELFMLILRYWKNQSINLELEQEISDEIVKKIQNSLVYISKNYTDVTALIMAEKCNLSYSYFSRVFKAVMNKSFTEYVNFIKISQAEKMLITTDKSVTEISMATGFSTTSYFIECFKKQKQLSPKKFRELYRNY